MPLTKKIQKADIVQAALEILKTEPLDNLTTRRLAEELHCSVQPIFYNFATMDDLKARALDAIHQIYLDYMAEASAAPLPYKSMGLAYIRFARDYPNYFKILFMGQTDHNLETFADQDTADDVMIQHGMEFSGLSRGDQKKFHLKVAIFTHGLAALIANGTAQITDAEADALLAETVHAMLIGHKRLAESQPAESQSPNQRQTAQNLAKESQNA